MSTFNDLGISAADSDGTNTAQHFAFRRFRNRDLSNFVPIIRNELTGLHRLWDHWEALFCSRGRIRASRRFKQKLSLYFLDGQQKFKQKNRMHICARLLVAPPSSGVLVGRTGRRADSGKRDGTVGAAIIAVGPAFRPARPFAGGLSKERAAPFLRTAASGDERSIRAFNGNFPDIELSGAG